MTDHEFRLRPCIDAFRMTAVVVALLSIGCDNSSTSRGSSSRDVTSDNAADSQATLLERIARANGDQRPFQQIQRDNAFIEAIRQQQLATAAELLIAGANPSAGYIDAESFLSAGQTGYTALLYAALNGDAEAVKLLLKHNANVNDQRKGKNALYFAAIGGHSEIAALLKAAGAHGDPEAIRRTHDLIRAACRGFEMGPGEGYSPYPGVPRDAQTAPMIPDVLKQGADVNAADPEGYTPLMYAANLGLIDNVKTLLANGADPSRKSKRGETAASLASGDSSVNREERAQIVKLLDSHPRTGP